MDRAKLAEAIILQALDDLFDSKECLKSVEFFTGDGFARCAEMACMDHQRKVGLLDVVSRTVAFVLKPGSSDLRVRGRRNLPGTGRLPGVMGKC